MSWIQFRQYINKTRFERTSGSIFHFDAFQDGPASYDVSRYDGIREKSWSHVGVIDDISCEFCFFTILYSLSDYLDSANFSLSYIHCI